MFSQVRRVKKSEVRTSQSFRRSHSAPRSVGAQLARGNRSGGNFEIRNVEVIVRAKAIRGRHYGRDAR
jgi:hypothetical protein